MFSRLRVGFRKISLQGIQGFATTSKPVVKAAKVAPKAPKVPKVPKVPAADKRNIGRLDMVDAVVKDTKIEISKAKVDQLLVSSLSLIKRFVLEENKEVRFTGLGTFYKRSTAARTRRNPSTGATFESPASEKLGFRPSLATRSMVKK